VTKRIFGKLKSKPLLYERVNAIQHKNIDLTAFKYLDELKSRDEQLLKKSNTLNEVRSK